MKQITLKQAQSLSKTSSVVSIKDETRYCQADWIRENAHHIADVEMRRTDKTFYGEWPKGWKAEMKRAAAAKAESLLLHRFLRDKCKELDGAIWLGDWAMIQQMEKNTP